MGGLVAGLLVVAALLMIIKFAVWPPRQRVTGRWFPSVDKGIGTTGTHYMPWRRGSVLAALATVALADLAAAADEGTGVLGIAFIGGAAAVLYRWLPGPTGAALGIIGSIAAFAGAFTAACTDPGALRAVTVIVVVLLGLAAFFVATAVRVSAILVFIRTSAASLPLAMFGVIELGTFVGGPFGLELTALAGPGAAFIAIVGLYLAICAGAGFLLEFTTSVLGAALLAAHVIVDLAVGDPCSDRSGVLLVTLLGFVAAWTLARRFARRPDRG